MNVYSCWYRGNMGYCCRLFNMNWMFVPELGQPDSTIYRNIDFKDLVFTNSYARKYESEIQYKLEKAGPAASLIKMLKKKSAAQTIGGLLFCTTDI